MFRGRCRITASAGRASCFETVILNPPDYERVAAERYRFIVAPGHEDSAIEQGKRRRSSCVSRTLTSGSNATPGLRQTRPASARPSDALPS